MLVGGRIQREPPKSQEEAAPGIAAAEPSATRDGLVRILDLITATGDRSGLLP